MRSGFAFSFFQGIKQSKRKRTSCNEAHENDARRLDHKTLEEIRTRALQRVQVEESPEVVLAVLAQPQLHL